jgi:hypothetical protein
MTRVRSDGPFPPRTWGLPARLAGRCCAEVKVGPRVSVIAPPSPYGGQITGNVQFCDATAPTTRPPRRSWRWPAHPLLCTYCRAVITTPTPQPPVTFEGFVAVRRYAVCAGERFASSACVRLDSPRFGARCCTGCCSCLPRSGASCLRRVCAGRCSEPAAATAASGSRRPESWPPRGQVAGMEAVFSVSETRPPLVG